MNRDPILPVTQHFTVKIASENSLIYYAEQPVMLTGLYRQLSGLFEKESLSPWQVELIPAFKSLLVTFNALMTDHAEVAQVIKGCAVNPVTLPETKSKQITLPVLYDETLAPDLSRVAKRCQLTVAQVIEAHAAVQYKVQAVGFAPGFGYLGELDEKLAMPRFTTPRIQVPKGAVAIANNQTAVYPEASPGGWHIIGFCPLVLFDRHAKQPLPYNVGDTVVFEAISKQVFVELQGDLNALRQFAELEQCRQSTFNG